MATRQQQVYRLVRGFASAGFAVIEGFDASVRPVHLEVTDGDRSRQLRAFCWNVTAGGRGRAEDERRVQTTRPKGVPLFEPGEHLNLVLGYDEERDLFAAWDAAKHRDPGRSSSLQIPLATLEEAARTGFAAKERPLGSTDVVEVVVAFRPELIADYLELMPRLDATNPEEGAATAAAVSGEQQEPEELPGDVERRRSIATVSRLVRDARFRSAVLRAYDWRCAFCDLGLGLAQAAHINPVFAGGTDQPANGLAACPTHHAAFDRGYLVVADGYEIRLNSARTQQLGMAEADIDRLAAGLRAELRVPDEPHLQPSAEGLRAHRARWS